MVTTVDEAKNGKFCPIPSRGEHWRCLGDECMAWRYWDLHPDGKFDPDERKGFCGLGGEIKIAK